MSAACCGVTTRSVVCRYCDYDVLCDMDRLFEFELEPRYLAEENHVQQQCISIIDVKLAIYSH